jgi:hypothetical protein
MRCIVPEVAPSGKSPRCVRPCPDRGRPIQRGRPSLSDQAAGQGALQRFVPAGQPQGPVAFLAQKAPTMFGNCAAQSASTVHLPQSAAVMVGIGVAHRVVPSVACAQTQSARWLQKMKFPDPQLSAPAAHVPCPATQVPTPAPLQRCPAGQQTAPQTWMAGQQLPPMQRSPLAQQAAPHA